MVTLDVIVLQCGLSHLTVRLLESIHRINDGAVDINVILVDNGSPLADVRAAEDALARYCRRATFSRNRENLGFAKAVNQGLRLGRGDYVCIQNNDTVMRQSGDYGRLVAHLAHDPGIGCVGPLTNAAETVQRVPGPDAVTVEPKVEYTDGLVAFFCAVIPRRVVAEVGPLSEEFGLGYGEDDDYCIRLRRAGYRLGIAHDVFVHHDHHATYLQTIGQDGIDREGAQGHAKLQELYGHA